MGWQLAQLSVPYFDFQNSTPMRHKKTHFVNIPHYGIRFFEFAVSLLSDKLKDRVMVSYNHVLVFILSNHGLQPKQQRSSLVPSYRKTSV